jgi:hypothetical protein
MVKTILALLLAFTSAGFAQNDPQPQTEKKNSNSIEKGKFAVMIGVGENFTLSSFGDFTMAVKYHFSKRSALRLGASGDYHSYDGTAEEINYIYSSYRSLPLYRTDRGFSATLQLVYYLKPDSKINIYTGIGPRGAFSDMDAISYGYTGLEHALLYERYYGFGGTASLGFEWFPVNFVSLTAEYYAYLLRGNNYRKRSYYDEEGFITSREVIDLTTTDFYWRNAFLGLTIYFSL